ncbi:hypothetical protein MPDQ_006242 [Monascus purpureus]|uniref:Uncharacterized protein n=1 Tax=Monascus purpureus TaxID=5098 RepID=A0A507QYU5_MONPU|nr:hypothetical protein MPDQ_006242 [Monascus purpureus]
MLVSLLLDFPVPGNPLLLSDHQRKSIRHARADHLSTGRTSSRSRPSASGAGEDHVTRSSNVHPPPYQTDEHDEKSRPWWDGTKPWDVGHRVEDSYDATTEKMEAEFAPKKRDKLLKRKARIRAKLTRKQTLAESYLEKSSEAKEPEARAPDVIPTTISRLPIRRVPSGPASESAGTPKKKSGEDSILSEPGGARISGSLTSKALKLTPLDVERAPVPKLSFGLERVLFNPGVYHLRDPRSRVFNFDPYLGSIMPVTEFDFTALKDYITSSRDETLRRIAAKEKKKYIGSSSSMTSVLSQFHYLLSAWRPIDASVLSQSFPDSSRSFTRLSRAPAAIILNYQNGIYAVDADKEFESANILMNLGKSMEKLLTLPKEEFERYRRSHENKISAEEERAIPESYHYSTFGDFIMRSQLDAYDPRLPGTGMFDLKTRAVVSIRMDARNFEHGLGYEIRSRFGAFESYEREFFDMIRAAFLKYSLQVRIGRMDGIFVAFHNIQRIFGFQYISLPEMDKALHGQSDTALGDKEFELSLALWNKVLNKVTAKFPKRSVRLHFESRDTSVPFMYIFAEPVTDEEIHAIQTKNKADIEAYQQRILNLTPQGGELDLTRKQITSDKSESRTQDVSKEGIAAPIGEQAAAEETETEAEQKGKQNSELLAMTLFIKNKVNGEFVERPTRLEGKDEWAVEYVLREVPSSRAASLYEACQKRRRVALEGVGEDEAEENANYYIRMLRDIARRGREWREQEDELDRKQGIVVLEGAIQAPPSRK